MSKSPSLHMKMRVVTFRIKDVVTFCVKKLLQFPLKKLLYFTSKVVTNRVNVTFCVKSCYISS